MALSVFTNLQVKVLPLSADILNGDNLLYIRLITRVSVRYGEIFHEPKASEISRHISQLTSVISALFL